MCVCVPLCVKDNVGEERTLVPFSVHVKLSGGGGRNSDSETRSGRHCRVTLLPSFERIFRKEAHCTSSRSRGDVILRVGTWVIFLFGAASYYCCYD